MYTQEQYNTLCEAIAMGATKVKYSDKEVEYRSLADMERIKRMMESDLGIAKKQSGKVLIDYRRGTNDI